MKRLGKEPRFVGGMRVTDAETMDVVEMVLVGRINKEIVGLINLHGGRAVGLSGKDGELIRARKMKMGVKGPSRGGRVDIGMVGDVVAVDPSVIDSLDRSDFIPVIAPVGVGEQGESFNINADLVAAKVAEALRAEKLLLLTDVEGIRDADGMVIPTLDADRARTLIGQGVITEGMIPKVECCLGALSGGVRKTHVVDGRVRHAVLLEVLTPEGVGTQVVRTLPRRGGRQRADEHVSARGAK
jgi:acetylglutamate kinase